MTRAGNARSWRFASREDDLGCIASARLQMARLQGPHLTPAFTRIAAELRSIVGTGGYLDDQSAHEAFVTEWRGLYRGSTPMVLLPASTDQVAAILRVCSTHRIGVVPQGGNTGLVGGAIRISAERTQVLVSPDAEGQGC